MIVYRYTVFSPYLMVYRKPSIANFYCAVNIKDQGSRVCLYVYIVMIIITAVSI